MFEYEQMKIHLIKSKATEQQIQEMMETLQSYIKLAVDIERGVLAGGGELHADCEALLLQDGSKQENVWGANWIPSKKKVGYEAMLNISTRRKNPSMEIQDPKIRTLVDQVVRRLLEI